MEYSYNDKELEALKEIDEFAGLLFFRMKSQMDFKSKTIGKIGKKISLLSLRKDMYRKPIAGIKKANTGMPSIQNIRTALNRLIEAGVLKRIEGERIENLKGKKEGLTTLVYCFPLASSNPYAFIQGNTETQHENSDASSYASVSQQEASALEIPGLQGNEDDEVDEAYDEYCVASLTHEGNTYHNTLNPYHNSYIVDSIKHNIKHCSTSKNGAHFSQKNARFFTEEKFEEFYRLYPKHKDRKKAVSAFKKHITNEKIFLELLDGVRRRLEHDQYYLSIGKDPDFWPYAATYLNNERWKDEFNFNEVHNETNRRNTQTSSAERIKKYHDEFSEIAEQLREHAAKRRGR